MISRVFVAIAAIGHQPLFHAQQTWWTKHVFSFLLQDLPKFRLSLSLTAYQKHRPSTDPSMTLCICKILVTCHVL